MVDGNVLYDSEQGICVPARRRRIGYMFQDYALFPHLSVLHNVAYAGTGLLPWRLNGEQRTWAMDLLERLGIAHLARLYPGNLSGGQKQRVALARALGTRPSLLLLDEPFSALDPLLRERLRGEIQEILAAFTIPAVIISHDPHDRGLCLPAPGVRVGGRLFAPSAAGDAGRERPGRRAVARAGHHATAGSPTFLRLGPRYLR